MIRVGAVAALVLVAACAPGGPHDVPKIHVGAGATGNLADGSAAHPYATIARALAAAPMGAAILVGPGEYRERVIVRGPLALVGAGPARTRILAPDEADAALVTVDGDGAIVKDLAVAGGATGILVRGKGHLIANVSLWRQRDEGLRAENAELEFTDSEIVGTGFGGRAGRGAHFLYGSLRAQGLVLRNAGRRSLHVEGGTALVERCDIAGAGLTGLSVTALGRLEARDISVHGSGGAAIYAARARLLLLRSALADNEYGVTGAKASIVDLEDNQIGGYRQAGISLVGAQGLVARNAIYGGGETAGIAIVSSRGGRELRDNSLRTPGIFGLQIYGSEVRVVHNRVSGAIADKQGDFGAGVFAQQSDVDIERNVFTGNAGPGIALHLSRGRIRDNDADQNGGDGLVLADGSRADVTDNQLDRNRASGLAIDTSFAGSVRRNELRENGAFGAVLGCDGADEVLAGNALFGNKRGGSRCIVAGTD